MRNKKRISILAVVLAFAIIFTGAFAFFSDSSMFDDSAKVAREVKLNDEKASAKQLRRDN